jgi:hypothetical protein
LVLIVSWDSFASDVYLTSKLENQRLNNYISQLRQGLRTQTGRDPSQGRIEDEFVIDLSASIPSVDPSTQAWILGLERIFKIDRLGGKLELRIKGIEFELAGQGSSLKVQQNEMEKVDFRLSTNLQGLKVKIDRFSLQVVIKNGSNPIEISTALTEVEMILASKLKAPFLSQITSLLTPKNFIISYDLLNIFPVMEELSYDSSALLMKFDQFLMPEVSVGVGHYELKFDRLKIQKYIKENLDLAKDFILHQMVMKQQEELSTIFSESPIKQAFAREQFFPLEIKTGVWINELMKQNNEMVSLGFRIDVCEDSVTTYGECQKSSLHAPFEMRNKNLIFFGLRSFPEDADIMVSISQPKINDFLFASVKKNLWDKVLAEENLQWASLGAFLQTGNEGDVFDLYLDVIHQFERSERILIGRDQIRFPIHYRVKLTVEKEAEIPTFFLKVVEVDIDDQFLLYGNQSLGLVSTIHSVPRMKKKVLARVKEKVGAYNGRTMFKFALPKVLGDVVDRVDFVADKKGNLHGFFDLKELSF